MKTSPAYGNVFTKKHGLYCLSHLLFFCFLVSCSLLFAQNLFLLFFNLPQFLTLWKVNGEGRPQNGQNIMWGKNTEKTGAQKTPKCHKGNPPKEPIPLSSRVVFPSPPENLSLLCCCRVGPHHSSNQTSTDVWSGRRRLGICNGSVSHVLAPFQQVTSRVATGAVGSSTIWPTGHCHSMALQMMQSDC